MQIFVIGSVFRLELSLIFRGEENSTKNHPQFPLQW